MRLLTPILIGVLIAFAGCDNSGIVDVVDPAGNPVAGASVTPVTASMNGNAVTADGKGEALIPTSMGVQATHWVSVSKAGFTAVQVPVPKAWPLRVTLAPAAASQTAPRP
jgi:hypothetical protein